MLTSDIQVTGSVQDDDLAAWTLEYRVPGTSTWNRIGNGDTAVANGVLGTFPATLVANGPYRVRLTGFDTSQAITSEVEVQVDSKDLKLGDFTLAYEDLRLPALTFPISITRTYDTKRLYAGDFGPGWFLSFTGVDLRRAANNDIYVTLPSGRRVQFQFSPIRTSCSRSTRTATSGRPVSPTRSRPPTAPYLFGGGGTTCADSSRTSPQDFILKTTEGLTYTLHATGAIAHRGSRRQFRRHLASAVATSWGLVVPITRGADNRITRIGEPSGPNGITYSYDPSGRLVEVRDQANQPTQFLYEDSRFPNYLTTSSIAIGTAGGADRSSTNRPNGGAVQRERQPGDAGRLRALQQRHRRPRPDAGQRPRGRTDLVLDSQRQRRHRAPVSRQRHVPGHQPRVRHREPAAARVRPDRRQAARDTPTTATATS